mmetsp:Transcript_65281/g.168576  ORF Transcript_65281/g.168576 Transcript_65281/m.168576 type:complete len:917 (-) Transcript_65281:25-2775(-)
MSADAAASSSVPKGGYSYSAGPSERALAALKPFARIAWEECREPLPESAGPARTRWEIHSTWTLLLCLHHAEAEAERCVRAGWQPQEWRTEAQALRHIFLEHRSLRMLGAVLRWLRWAHSWGPECSQREDDGCGAGADASYERTRRTLQLKGSLSEPLQGAPTLHPDGPLQQPGRFDEADLVDEVRLMRRLLRALRRGDLRGAMQICSDGGQPWRVALLQGMFPYAEGSASAEAEAGYAAMDDDDDEDVLAAVKEEHTDWSEIGTLEHPGCNGNPWRRIWKEQCWDTAQRHLQRSSTPMSLQELAISGFCSGHQDALLPACSGSWADRLWAELHCMKEWLVESLLDEGRAKWCPSDVFLGEGDCGCPDPSETPETRSARRDKLCGALRGTRGTDLDAVVAREVQRIVVPRVSEDLNEVASSFAALQATIVCSAWEPERGDEVIAMLRTWLGEGVCGSPCPFVVKQFASHFAIWQKESLEQCDVSKDELNAGGGDAAGNLEALRSNTGRDVDDIVRELVGDLVAAASGAWQKQCIEGHAIELIAEHVSAMTAASRVSAFASLLVQMGSRSGEVECGTALELRLEALKRCIWVFWDRFPEDIFALLAVLVRKALCLDASSAEEVDLPSLGLCGIRKAVTTSDLSLVLLSIMMFWVVARDKAEAGEFLEEALRGLESVLGSSLPEGERPESTDDFARLVLDAIALPCFADTLLTLTVQDPTYALGMLPLLQSSALWSDAISCKSPGLQTLTEIEWFLGLCRRQSEWSQAGEIVSACRQSQPVSGCGSGMRLLGPGWHDARASQAELERSTARDSLLDWARPRLAQDRPLLEPPLRAHTTLPEQQWERLCGAVACRSLFVLLSVFEGESDFDGAMNDLVVAVAQSPWMLRRLEPHHARAFLSRLAVVPMRLEDEHLCAAF